MKPRLLLYILVALAGATCLYRGLKIRRDIIDDGTTHQESLTVGLATSPLYTQTKTLRQAEGAELSTPDDPVPASPGSPLSVTTSWHPLSASALLAAVGLALLLTAGRLRKKT